MHSGICIVDTHNSHKQSKILKKNRNYLSYLLVEETEAQSSFVTSSRSWTSQQQGAMVSASLPFSAVPHRTFPSCFCLLSVFQVCLSCYVDCKLWGQAPLVFPLPTESSTIPSSKKLLSQCRITEDAVFVGYLQTTHPLSWRKGTKFAVRWFSLWTQQPESRQMEKHIVFF